MRRFSASRVARAARPCRRCDSFSRAMRYSRRAPGSTLRSASSRSSPSSRVFSARHRSMSARPASRVSLARSGSSPRVRGKDDLALHRGYRQGIIPAGAGKRDTRSALESQRRDHPRGCGEKLSASAAGRGLPGSSPRVRGKVAALGLPLSGSGIIPAGAGKRGEVYSEIKGSGDHPRGCGEKTLRWVSVRFGRGSSPRVRGKGVAELAHRRRPGIIPAGAGKRSRPL